MDTATVDYYAIFYGAISVVRECCAQAAIRCSAKSSGEAGAALYIPSMANRPCKPDGDLKKLWQTLMPGIAMPACGTAAGDAARENATPPEQDQAPPPNDALRRRR